MDVNGCQIYHEHRWGLISQVAETPSNLLLKDCCALVSTLSARIRNMNGPARPASTAARPFLSEQISGHAWRPRPPSGEVHSFLAGLKCYSSWLRSRRPLAPLCCPIQATRLSSFLFALPPLSGTGSDDGRKIVCHIRLGPKGIRSSVTSWIFQLGFRSGKGLKVWPSNTVRHVASAAVSGRELNVFRF